MKYVTVGFPIHVLVLTVTKADAEQLRKRLTEAEMSHARTKHDVGAEQYML